MIVLHRVDPPKRQYRWYSLHVQPTLLDPWAVVCAWGSLRNSFRQERAIPCASREAAERLAAKIAADKGHRGYKIVESPLDISSAPVVK